MPASHTMNPRPLITRSEKLAHSRILITRCGTPLFTLALVLSALAGTAAGQSPVITSVVDAYSGGTALSPGSIALITGSNLGTAPKVVIAGAAGASPVLVEFTCATPAAAGQFTIPSAVLRSPRQEQSITPIPPPCLSSRSPKPRCRTRSLLLPSTWRQSNRSFRQRLS